MELVRTEKLRVTREDETGYMLPSNNGLKHFHKFLYQICVTQEADLGSLIASRIVRNARHLSLQSWSFKDSCQRSQYLGARCHLLASSSALIQKRDKNEYAIGHAVGFRRVTSDSGAILSDLSGISIVQRSVSSWAIFVEHLRSQLCSRYCAHCARAIPCHPVPSPAMSTVPVPAKSKKEKTRDLKATLHSTANLNLKMTEHIGIC